MGACNCADGVPDFRFEGPDGVTYTLSIYPPCSDCQTPAGVILGKVSDDDLGLYGVPLAEVLHFDPALDYTILIPVIDRSKLQEQLVESCSEATINSNGETYDAKDFIADIIENERPFENAVQATIKEWDDERKAGK